MIFTTKMTQWLSKNVHGKTFNEITHLFNSRFNTVCTPHQIKGRCIYYGIKADRKGKTNKDCEVGTEKVIDKRSGVVYIKISRKTTKGCSKVGLPGTWRQKHFVIWEAVNGPVPKSHIVIFADRNKINFEIDNLILVSKKELFYMCKHEMLSSNPDLTKTNLLIVRHRLLIIDRVNRLTGKRHHYSVEDKYRRFRLKNNSLKNVQMKVEGNQ
jgi:hypothetical protein